MKFVWGVLAGLLLSAMVYVAYLNATPRPPSLVDGCPVPRSADVVSAMKFGLTLKDSEKVLGGNIDPQAVGKDLPAQFVKEEGRAFALCLYDKRHPKASEKDRLCYTAFLAAAEDPAKLENYRKSCLADDRVSHQGELQNIVFNMADSPSVDQITLAIDDAVRGFWVRTEVNASGFGALVKKICSLPESSCLKCQQEGERFVIGLKPNTELVGGGSGYPADARFCAK